LHGETAGVSLTLATALALAGARAVVVEALEVRSGPSKAMNLYPRTAEMFESRRLLSDADVQAVGRIGGGTFARIFLDYAALGTRYPYQVGTCRRG
jgi:2-polyprenyl-6-methoxyphenol hydroxylase-like FAD-dependent oxidoreductase